MPRLPVDGKKVIEHRYTLGQYERDQLDTLITGVTVRNVGAPITNILGNPFALTSMIALLEAFGIIDLTGVVKRLGDWFQGWVDDLRAGNFNTPQEAEEAFNLIAAGIDVLEFVVGPEIPGTPFHGAVAGSIFQHNLTAAEKVAVWVYTSLGNVNIVPGGLA